MKDILFISLLGVMSYIASETRFGLYLYAIGNNAEAARRTGIKVDRIKITAFSIAGGLAAFGGILSASRILGVSVSSGGGVGGGALLLESIAAAVIGGVSLFGGRGHVVGALFGALIIATVSNGLNLMGVANEARLRPHGPGLAPRQKFQPGAAVQHDFQEAVLEPAQSGRNPNRSLAAQAADVSGADLPELRPDRPKRCYRPRAITRRDFSALCRVSRQLGHSTPARPDRKFLASLRTSA